MLWIPGTKRTVSRFRNVVVASYLLVFAVPLLSLAQTDITLKNSFIKKYMHRTTIETRMIIDLAHDKPNVPAKDGDLHITGRCKDVGLPMVAEIMNAASETTAVKFVTATKGKNKSVKMSGAWRLWCEHPGANDHIQGQNVAVPKTTNPDHVFEIHPITRLDTMNLIPSLHPIAGYDAYLEDTFEKFDMKHLDIIPHPAQKTVTLVTKMIGYNYVEFTMELTGDKQVPVGDGRFVTANVLDKKGEPVAEDVRMVFVKGSAPETTVRTMKGGETLHVLGIPRINLEEVWRRVGLAKKKPQLLHSTLPFEIIVVGIF